jgi:hypothetical protein
MASLAELHAALVALGQGGKTAKLYFYYTEPGEMRQHSGFLFVDRGHTCYVSMGGLDADTALARLPRLAFSKVAWLPAIQLDPAMAATPAFSLASVVERLDPARQPRLAPVVEPVPAPAPSEAFEPSRAEFAPEFAAIFASEPEPVAPPAAPARAQGGEAHVFYSHMALQKDALAVLEGIYGLGVGKKLQSIANTTPPHQYPMEFVAKCRQHAAVMLGDRKAGELFRSIEEKVAAHLH